MKRINQVVKTTVFLLLFSVCLGFTKKNVSAEEVTITGRVNAYFQIETEDGALYDIAMTTIGDEVVGLVGARIQATGTVSEFGGKLMLFVSSYHVLEDIEKESQIQNSQVPTQLATGANNI